MEWAFKLPEGKDIQGRLNRMMSPVPSAYGSPSVFHDHCMLPSLTHILIFHTVLRTRLSSAPFNQVKMQNHKDS